MYRTAGSRQRSSEAGGGCKDEPAKNFAASGEVILQIEKPIHTIHTYILICTYIHIYVSM